ncbi:glycosyltransferase 61 family protein [Alteromonas ponticola]|uniref:glycosyltransferase 61 family protein n=1 Tax=Alteromonas ponticola TaxID=2720613 RepID=UPI001B7D1AFE|nr:glycosyltransferase family 61 protein [Alteromonas ponticola]
MAECIHRLRLYNEGGDRTKVKKVIFQPKNRIPDFKEGLPVLPPHFYETLEYLGMEKSKVCLQTKQMTVKNLIVSEEESLFRSGIPVSKPFLDFLKSCEANANIKNDPALPKRLYVSRTPFRLRGAFAGEAYLDKFMENNGFDIFRPEAYPLIEQLKRYKSAEQIVFAEGAAVHVMELVGSVDANVYLLQRKKNSQRVFKQVLEPRTVNTAYFSDVHELPSLFQHQNLKIVTQGSALSIPDIDKMAHFLQQELRLDGFDKEMFAGQIVSDVINYYRHYHSAVWADETIRPRLSLYKEKVTHIAEKLLVQTDAIKSLVEFGHSSD